jgi:hypothetical protein
MTGAPRAMIVALVAGAALVAPSAAAGASSAAAQERACEPVRNPYPGTRYEGVDLTNIRALRASCKTARRVARRAHYKALGLPLPADGIHRFTWKGWRVRGDLRPDKDKYVARKGTRRVRWRF